MHSRRTHDALTTSKDTVKHTPLPQVHSHPNREGGAEIIMALDAELSERFRLEKLSPKSVPTDFSARRARVPLEPSSRGGAIRRRSHAPSDSG